MMAPSSLIRAGLAGLAPIAFLAGVRLRLALPRPRLHPAVSRRQLLALGHLGPAGASELGRPRGLGGSEHPPASRLRQRAGGRALGHPLRGGGQVAAGREHRLHRLRGRKRSRPLSHPAGLAHRRRARLRRGPPRAGRGQGRERPVRAVPGLPQGVRLGGRERGEVRPRLQRPAPRRLDLRRRGRPAHPAGPGALRRAGPRRDRPRHPHDRAGEPPPVHLARPPPGGLHRQDRRPAHGPALPPQGRLRHLEASRPPARSSSAP